MCLVQVALVVVGVDGRHLVGLVLGEELDALVGLEVVLDPEPLARGVDPHVSVRAVAVHVPPGPRDPAVTHQPGDLVRRLRGQGPEVPLHVVVAQVVVRAALLGADEVLELHGVAHEEHRGVVPDHVVVALGRVELQREPARVTPGVGAAPLTGHRGEPDQRVGPGAGLEHRGPGVGADVAGHLEVAERAAALGVRLPLRDPLPVEVRHLLDQVMILQQDGPFRAGRQRELVALDRDAGVGGRGYWTVVCHCHTSSSRCTPSAELSAALQAGHTPQKTTSASSTANPVSSAGVRHG